MGNEGQEKRIRIRVVWLPACNRGTGLGRPKEEEKEGSVVGVCLTRTSLTNEMGQTVPSVRQGRCH